MTTIVYSVGFESLSYFRRAFRERFGTSPGEHHEATPPRTARHLALLVPVGLTALSNYLLQTVICTLIFTGYGLGYAGAVGVVAGVALACLIFLAQIGLSTVWVRHFRFGPAEWLWRSLTYRSWQPMRLRQKAPVLAPLP